LVQEAVDTLLDNGIRGQPMRDNPNKVYKSGNTQYVTCPRKYFIIWSIHVHYLCTGMFLLIQFLLPIKKNILLYGVFMIMIETRFADFSFFRTEVITIFGPDILPQVVHLLFLLHVEW
jgi:hypothetical protein